MSTAFDRTQVTNCRATAEVSARAGWSVRGLTLGVILLGVWLRTAWLGEQVVLGDEIHSIRALKGTLGHILTHYQVPDNCIPISAWCKILSLSVGLEEWGLRSLSYLPGIVLILVAVRATRALLPPSERLILAVLLACSPLLVFWSRSGRPYSAISLLGVLAVLALWRYGERRTLRWCAVCALCQFGLFLFSPTTVPAIAGISLAAAVWGFQQGEPGRPVRARLGSALGMVKPAILAVLITLVVMAFALPSLLETLTSEKRHTASVSGKTLVHFAQLLYGFPRSLQSQDRLLLLIPVGLTLLGLIRFCRARRSLALPACLALFTSPVLYALFRFQGLNYASVLVRYQAAVIPFFLFFLAHGVGGILQSLRRLTPLLAHAALAVALLLVAALTFLGPLRSGLGPGRPFGLLFSRLHEQWLLSEIAMTSHIPDFYHQLGQIEDLVLIECGIGSKRDRQIAAYQQLHGGRVILCHDLAADPDAKVVLRTLVIGLDTVLTELSSGTYVVLHLDPDAEKTFFKFGRRREEEKRTGRRRNDPRVRSSAQRCRKFFGERVYEDKFIVVYGRRGEGDPRFVQPARESETGKAALLDRSLVFSATPSVAAPGEIVAFETVQGLPGEHLVLAVVARNGRPVRIEIATGLADADGLWRRSIRIPTTSRPMTLLFELTGNRHDAVRAAESRVQVAVGEP